MTGATQTELEQTLVKDGEAPPAAPAEEGA